MSGWLHRWLHGRCLQREGELLMAIDQFETSNLHLSKQLEAQVEVNKNLRETLLTMYSQKSLVQELFEEVPTESHTFLTPSFEEREGVESA